MATNPFADYLLNLKAHPEHIKPCLERIRYRILARGDDLTLPSLLTICEHFSACCASWPTKDRLEHIGTYVTHLNQHPDNPIARNFAASYHLMEGEVSPPELEAPQPDENPISLHKGFSKARSWIFDRLAEVERYSAILKLQSDQTPEIRAKISALTQTILLESLELSPGLERDRIITNLTRLSTQGIQSDHLYHVCHKVACRIGKSTYEPAPELLDKIEHFIANLKEQSVPTTIVETFIQSVKTHRDLFFQRIQETYEAYFNGDATPDDVRKLQTELTDSFCGFIREHIIEGPLCTFFSCLPKCSIIAVGSIAREEVSLLSDLELIILTERHPQQAIRLYDLIDLITCTLTEGPTTYNPYTQPASRRIKGLFLDKIPIFSDNYLPVGSSSAFLEWHKTNAPDETKEHFSLMSPKLLSGDHDIYTDFCHQLQALAPDLRQARAQAVLESLTLQEPTEFKDHLMQPIQLAIAGLYSYHKPDLLPNTLDAIDVLTTCFEPSSIALLKRTYAGLYLIRQRIDYERYISHCQHRSLPQNIFTKDETTFIARARALVLKPLLANLGALKDPAQPLDLAKYAFQVAVDKARIEPGDDLQDTVSYYTDYLIASNASFDDILEAYRELSTFSAAEPSRGVMLKRLEKARYLNREQLDELYAIPNSDGFRQSFSLERRKLIATIEGMTLPSGEGPVIEVPGLGKRVLKSTIDIFTPTGDIKKHYADSRHNVCPIEGYNLHIKQNPDHPCMEYAIGSLMHRLFGHPMPAIELARITHGGKSYPVLLSQTILGDSLADVLKKNPKKLRSLDKRKFTEMLIAQVLTLPGDAWPRNFILAKNHLICIDSDISFVEPVIEHMIRSNTIQFTSILFCLNIIETLDPDALEAFCDIRPEVFLHNWLQDLIIYEKQCCKLFQDSKERKILLEKDPDNAFTPALLLRSGTIARLYQQILSLQSLFRDKPSLTPYDLLDHMLGTFGTGKACEQIGSNVRCAYQKYNTLPPEEQLKKATRKNANASMTSSQAHMASLGRVPSAKEVDKRQEYAPEQALQELFVLEMQRCSESVLVTKTSDGTTVDSYFKRMTKNGQPDIERQALVLSILARLPKIHHLNLAGCAALTDERLKTLMHAHKNTLIALDLRYCDQITSSSIGSIAELPHLEELYLSHCAGITTIGQSTGYFTSEQSVEFKTLITLHIAHCQTLRTLRIKAPNLTTIKANGNPLLTDVSPDAATGVYKPLIPEAFGGHVWAKYFGYIGDEPSLPLDIVQQLAMPCPIWPDKTVGETHVLMLIPSRLNGKKLTLERLGEVVTAPRLADAPKSKYSDWSPYGNEKACADRNYWVLMSKDVLPESRKKPYTDQLKLVEEAAQKSGCGYRIPKLIEAAVCIFMHHVRSGDVLYPDNPRTYTRCVEKSKYDWQMAVGGFGGVSGLRVNDCWSYDRDGLGAVREVLL